MFLIQQTKTKYEIEAEKRELARLLEKRTQEVENLTGKGFNNKLCKIMQEKFLFGSTFYDTIV